MTDPRATDSQLAGSQVTETHVPDPRVAASTASLRQRLMSVAPYLGVTVTDPSIGHGPLLALLADTVALRPDPASVWLLSTAAAGGFPTVEEVDAVRRGLELATPGTAFGAVLSGIARTASAQREDALTAIVLEGATIVDVDFCAKHVHNTGIQRVVRSTMPTWEKEHDPVFVAWSGDVTGFRELTPAQRTLVLEWSSSATLGEADAPAAVLVIPWKSTVVIPEVPDRSLLERQVALARFSGNRVGLIGYDAIPIVSADSVIDDESDRFSHYLTVVKHSTAVSCISETTAGEFRSFVDELPAQGLTGPRVTAVPLPVALPPRTSAGTDAATRTKPLALMVGSVERRKNQQAVLSAAQTLWDDGVDFELFVIGGGHSWYLARFDREVRRLQRAGRSVSVGRGVPDSVLNQAYRDARVVVFPSLQEGYGLPVAEALATGTPVVTTGYGSTAEIAVQGGCLLVNPRDDDDIARALRSVLTDDAVHARLVGEALARRNDTWEQYAELLWADLAEPAVQA